MSETPEQRLLKVLEWLYVDDGSYKNRQEWREELVSQLKFLAGIEQSTSQPTEERGYEK